MKKILVIEDNAEVRENIAEIIELSAYTVLTAINGKEGIKIALQEIPDLIVCDIMMPVLDGYAVLHLLNQHATTYGIPFIFLTAKSEKADRRKGMELGADDYITKPFDGIELLRAIEIRLDKSDAVKKHFESINATGNLDTTINQLQQITNISLTSNERELYNFKRKYIIYSEGQRPKAVYYIQQGKVKTYKQHEDGKELVTDILQKGDFIGYTYVLENINYKETAEVLEDAEIMIIPKDDFLSLIATDAQVAKQFIKLVTHNVLAKEESLLNLAYNSLRKKVAYQIVALLDKFKNEHTGTKEIKLSREDLAQATGVATESLIRTLSDFKTEKLIDINGGTIIILNEDKLRNLPY